MMLKGRSKYNAIKTVVDGITFDSKKESKRYMDLKLLQAAGEVLYFLRQVPIRIPKITTYWVDFQVFWSDGRVTYEDVKGIRTTVYTLKKKLVEEMYPIKIVEI